MRQALQHFCSQRLSSSIIEDKHACAFQVLELRVQPGQFVECSDKRFGPDLAALHPVTPVVRQ